MSGFWKHYAQANDDIRNELVDRAWFNQRAVSSDMYQNVQEMEAKESLAEPEYNQIYVQDRAHQGEALDAQIEEEQHFKEVYGESQEQTEAQALYGYDALDEEEDLSQRM